MGLWNLLWGRKQTPDVLPLYAAIVEASRAQALYQVGVPDTLDGRFDMLILHLHLVVHQINPESRILSQTLFEYFIQNMDETLREMGVGDVSVGKRVRKMAQAYYGRARAYDEAFAASTPEQVKAALIGVLGRNLYPESEAAPPPLEPLATYIMDYEKTLATYSLTQIREGFLPNIYP